MADDEQKTNGFFVSNLTATMIILLIVFLGVVILIQNYRLGVTVETINLYHKNFMEQKAKP